MRPHCLCLLVILHALVVLTQGQLLDLDIPTNLQPNTPIDVKWKRRTPIQDRIRLRLIDSTANQEMDDAIEPTTLLEGEMDGTVMVTFDHVGTYIIRCNVGRWNGSECGRSHEINVPASMPTSTLPTKSFETEQSSTQDTASATTPHYATDSSVDSSTSSFSLLSASSSDRAVRSNTHATDKSGATLERLSSYRTTITRSVSADPAPSPSSLAEVPVATANKPSTASPSADRSRVRLGMIAGITLGSIVLLVLMGWLVVRKWRRKQRRGDIIDPFLHDSARYSAAILLPEDRKAANKSGSSTQGSSSGPTPTTMTEAPRAESTPGLVSQQPPMVSVRRPVNPSSPYCAHCHGGRSEDPRMLGSSGVNVLPSYEQACVGGHAAS